MPNSIHDLLDPGTWDADSQIKHNANPARKDTDPNNGNEIPSVHRSGKSPRTFWKRIVAAWERYWSEDIQNENRNGIEAYCQQLEVTNPYMGAKARLSLQSRRASGQAITLRKVKELALQDFCTESIINEKIMVPDNILEEDVEVSDDLHARIGERFEKAQNALEILKKHLGPPPPRGGDIDRPPKELQALSLLDKKIAENTMRWQTWDRRKVLLPIERVNPRGATQEAPRPRAERQPPPQPGGEGGGVPSMKESSEKQPSAEAPPPSAKESTAEAFPPPTSPFAYFIGSPVKLNGIEHPLDRLNLSPEVKQAARDLDNAIAQAVDNIDERAVKDAQLKQYLNEIEKHNEQLQAQQDPPNDLIVKARNSLRNVKNVHDTWMAYAKVISMQNKVVKHYAEKLSQKILDKEHAWEPGDDPWVAYLYAGNFLHTDSRSKDELYTYLVTNCCPGTTSIEGLRKAGAPWMDILHAMNKWSWVKADDTASPRALRISQEAKNLLERLPSVKPDASIALRDFPQGHLFDGYKLPVNLANAIDGLIAVMENVTSPDPDNDFTMGNPLFFVNDDKDKTAQKHQKDMEEMADNAYLAKCHYKEKQQPVLLNAIEAMKEAIQEAEAIPGSCDDFGLQKAKWFLEAVEIAEQYQEDTRGYPDWSQMPGVKMEIIRFIEYNVFKGERGHLFIHRYYRLQKDIRENQDFLNQVAQRYHYWPDSVQGNPTSKDAKKPAPRPLPRTKVPASKPTADAQANPVVGRLPRNHILKNEKIPASLEQAIMNLEEHIRECSTMLQKADWRKPALLHYLQEEASQQEFNEVYNKAKQMDREFQEKNRDQATYLLFLEDALTTAKDSCEADSRLPEASREFKMVQAFCVIHCNAKYYKEDQNGNPVWDHRNISSKHQAILRMVNDDPDYQELKNYSRQVGHDYQKIVNHEEFLRLAELNYGMREALQPPSAIAMIPPAGSQATAGAPPPLNPFPDDHCLKSVAMPPEVAKAIQDTDCKIEEFKFLFQQQNGAWKCVADLAPFSRAFANFPLFAIHRDAKHAQESIEAKKAELLNTVELLGATIRQAQSADRLILASPEYEKVCLYWLALKNAFYYQEDQQGNPNWGHQDIQAAERLSLEGVLCSDHNYTSMLQWFTPFWRVAKSVEDNRKFLQVAERDYGMPSSLSHATQSPSAGAPPSQASRATGSQATAGAVAPPPPQASRATGSQATAGAVAPPTPQQAKSTWQKFTSLFHSSPSIVNPPAVAPQPPPGDKANTATQSQASNIGGDLRGSQATAGTSGATRPKASQATTDAPPPRGDNSIQPLPLTDGHPLFTLQLDPVVKLAVEKLNAALLKGTNDLDMPVRDSSCIPGKDTETLKKYQADAAIFRVNYEFHYKILIEEQIKEAKRIIKEASDSRTLAGKELQACQEYMRVLEIIDQYAADYDTTPNYDKMKANGMTDADIQCVANMTRISQGKPNDMVRILKFLSVAHHIQEYVDDLDQALQGIVQPIPPSGGLPVVKLQENHPLAKCKNLPPEVKNAVSQLHALLEELYNHLENEFQDPKDLDRSEIGVASLRSGKNKAQNAQKSYREMYEKRVKEFRATVETSIYEAMGKNLISEDDLDQCLKYLECVNLSSCYASDPMTGEPDFRKMREKGMLEQGITFLQKMFPPGTDFNTPSIRSLLRHLRVLSKIHDNAIYLSRVDPLLQDMEMPDFVANPGESDWDIPRNFSPEQRQNLHQLCALNQQSARAMQELSQCMDALFHKCNNLEASIGNGEEVGKDVFTEIRKQQEQLSQLYKNAFVCDEKANTQEVQMYGAKDPVYTYIFRVLQYAKQNQQKIEDMSRHLVNPSTPWIHGREEGDRILKIYNQLVKLQLLDVVLFGTLREFPRLPESLSSLNTRLQRLEQSQNPKPVQPAYASALPENPRPNIASTTPRNDLTGSYEAIGRACARRTEVIGSVGQRRYKAILKSPKQILYNSTMPWVKQGVVVLPPRLQQYLKTYKLNDCEYESRLIELYSILELTLEFPQLVQLYEQKENDLNNRLSFFEKNGISRDPQTRIEQRELLEEKLQNLQEIVERLTLIRGKIQNGSGAILNGTVSADGNLSRGKSDTNASHKQDPIGRAIVSIEFIMDVLNAQDGTTRDILQEFGILPCIEALGYFRENPWTMISNIKRRCDDLDSRCRKILDRF